MKHIKLIAFTLSLFFISNLFADDFYYSLGEKIMLEVQPDIVLLRNSQFRKNKTSNIGGAELAFSKEYSHAKTSFQLFDVKTKKIKNNKLAAKLVYQSGILADYKGEVIVELDGNLVGTFDAATWKWNNKKIKEKNKTAAKDLIKVTAKLTKKLIV